MNTMHVVVMIQDTVNERVTWLKTVALDVKKPCEQKEKCRNQKILFWPMLPDTLRLLSTIGRPMLN